MLKVILAGLSCLTLLAACASEPVVQSGEDAEMVGNLAKVDHSRADLAYLDPNADFGKYNEILLTPLGLDNVEIIQPDDSIGSRSRGDWELTAEDKTKLQESFHEAMVKQLEEKGGYVIADQAGADVLLISAMITTIAPSAEKYQDQMPGRSTTFTESAGSMTIAITLADSQSEEVLGIIKDVREAGGQIWGRNNSVTNTADVRRLFNNWATQVRAGLDRAHGK